MTDTNHPAIMPELQRSGFAQRAAIEAAAALPCRADDFCRCRACKPPLPPRDYVDPRRVPSRIVVALSTLAAVALMLLMMAQYR